MYVYLLIITIGSGYLFYRLNCSHEKSPNITESDKNNLEDRKNQLKELLEFKKEIFLKNFDSNEEKLPAPNNDNGNEEKSPAPSNDNGNEEKSPAPRQ